jgi:hypothetical protein
MYHIETLPRLVDEALLVRDVTPASRAGAEMHQERWAERVRRLRGIGYDEELNEPKEQETWEPPTPDCPLRNRRRRMEDRDEDAAQAPPWTVCKFL